MSDIVNPFIAGNPVTGSEMFFGRKDVFQFIRQTLIGQHRDNVIVLYGQRRTGKTSVLYQTRSHLDARYLCIFMDMHGFALEGLGGFLWEMANHILRVLHRDHQVTLPPLQRGEFMADPRSFFENEFLNQVRSAIGDRHILLMLDEVIYLQEQVWAGKLEPEIFEYIRHLMQHCEWLNFLFSLGSGLEEMEKEYAFLFNVGLYKKISFLDRDDTSDLITQPVKDYYQVKPAAVERIYHITSGHPYYTQLLCHCLFNHWQRQRMSQVEIRDVNKVLDEATERGSAVLKYGWEELTPGEKTVVAAMAAAMGEYNHAVDAKDINRAWKRCNVFIPEGEMAKAIRSLIARDVITGQDKYAFTVDLQRLWVQKYRRIEWVKQEIADLPLEPLKSMQISWSPGVIKSMPIHPLTTPTTRPLSPTASHPLFSRKYRHLVLIISVLLILILASVFLLPLLFSSLSTSKTTTASSPAFVGRVFFSNSGQVNPTSSQGINDVVTIDLHGLAAPTSKKVYDAWLLPDQINSEVTPLLIGIALPAENVQMTYIDPTHTNLLATYNTFLITEDDASETPLIPSIDLASWSYNGSIPNIPTPGDPKQYSLLSHLRHLVAKDPTVEAIGLSGGLDIWLYRNSEKILQYATAARDETSSAEAIKDNVIRILQYLDGINYSWRDTPANSPWLIDGKAGHIGLLDSELNQNPPGYLTHVMVHLNGLATSPGVTESQKQLVIRIDNSIRSIVPLYQAVRTDAIQLVKMTNDQLFQSGARSLLEDMATKASYAYAGQPNTTNKDIQPGINGLQAQFQSLTTIEVSPVKHANSTTN